MEIIKWMNDQVAMNHVISIFEQYPMGITRSIILTEIQIAHRKSSSFSRKYVEIDSENLESLKDWVVSRVDREISLNFRVRADLGLILYRVDLEFVKEHNLDRVQIVEIKSKCYESENPYFRENVPILDLICRTRVNDDEDEKWIRVSLLDEAIRWSLLVEQGDWLVFSEKILGKNRIYLKSEDFEFAKVKVLSVKNKESLGNVKIVKGLIAFVGNIEFNGVHYCVECFGIESFELNRVLLSKEFTDISKLNQGRLIYLSDLFEFESKSFRLRSDSRLVVLSTLPVWLNSDFGILPSTLADIEFWKLKHDSSSNCGFWITRGMILDIFISNSQHDLSSLSSSDKIQFIADNMTEIVHKSCKSPVEFDDFGFSSCPTCQSDDIAWNDQTEQFNRSLVLTITDGSSTLCTNLSQESISSFLQCSPTEFSNLSSSSRKSEILARQGNHISLSLTFNPSLNQFQSEQITRQSSRFDTNLFL
jgi:hypothetical protein